MAILTKPITITKGVAASFEIDKAELVANSVVTASAYYSDTANWSKIVLAYKSSTGNQKETVVFDATVATPTANFLVSDQALDVFEIKKIEIYDFDGGHLPVYRADLIAAEFDVDMGGTPLTPVTWSRFNPSNISVYGVDGGLFKVGSDDWEQGASNSGAISGDFTLSFTVERLSVSSNIRIGFNNSATIPSSGANPDYGVHYGGSVGDLIIAGVAGAGVVSMAVSDINEFVFTRVGSTINLSIDGGAPIFIETFAGSVYPHCALFDMGFRLNSCGTL